jgi:hypothetical protein
MSQFITSKSVLQELVQAGGDLPQSAFGSEHNDVCDFLWRACAIKTDPDRVWITDKGREALIRRDEVSNWPKYESHKIVQAAKIVAIDVVDDKITIWVAAWDGAAIEIFAPTVPGMAEKAEVGGWAMLYPDGFKSISPAKQFEEGYTKCP